MIIKSIEYKNFKNLNKGKIEFSTDSEKKYTIIVGGTGFGKTTFVNSIIWCLYPDSLKSENFFSYDKTISMEVNDEEDIIVDIELEHENYDYFISTRQTYRKQSDGKCYALKNPEQSIMRVNRDVGITESITDKAQILKTIDKMLDKELFPYFIYDGERNKIEDVAKKGNLKKAVSQLMGFQNLEYLIKLMNPNSNSGVPSAISMRLKTNQKPEILDMYQTQKQEKNQLIAELKEEPTGIAHYENENIANQTSLEEKEEILNQNSDITDLQTSKKNYERDLITNKNSLNSKMTEILALINSSQLVDYMLSYTYNSNNIGSLPSESAFATELAVPDVSINSIDALIKRGKCLCGALITNDNDAYKHLIMQKNYAEPLNYPLQIKNLCVAEEQRASYCVDYYSNVYKKIEDLSTLSTLVEEIQDNLNDVIQRLSGRTDIGQVQKDINNLKTTIAHNEGIIESYKTQIAKLENEIKAIDQKIDSYVDYSDENKKTLKMKKIAEEIFEYENSILEASRTETLQRLNDVVDEIFGEMYAHTRKIHIDQDYKVDIDLLDGVPDILKPSTGQATVKNLAFVTGLLKVMKEQVKNQDVNYPLIMDAPFSTINEDIIQNVASHLGDYSNQVIIALMDKDYNIMKNHVANYTGITYRISRVNGSETDVVIKKEE